MSRIAIIGGGISGISAYRILEDKNEVSLFEKKSNLGGLVQCEWVGNGLFHKVGGHVFNSKVDQVNEWFWKFFDRENEFLKAKRNAKILINGKIVGYPIENYIYELDDQLINKIVDDILTLQAQQGTNCQNFEEFLKGNFGDTLYRLYFQPYNQKLWNSDLKLVPLEWLEGKLPMPNYNEIIIRNILRKEEDGMVHSTFYYPHRNGSQFIIDRLSEGMKKETGYEITSIDFRDEEFLINGKIKFDRIVYTGDIRKLSSMIEFGDDNLRTAIKEAENLRSNGTSNIFCTSDPTDISWLYLPEEKFKAHRIIYTGNFSPENNPPIQNRITCVVEFSGILDEEEMHKELYSLPGNLKPLRSNFEPNSYVIQNHDSRSIVSTIKKNLDSLGFHLLGRFAEWEYYNMDKCIESAMNLKEKWFK